MKGRPTPQSLRRTRLCVWRAEALATAGRNTLAISMTLRGPGRRSSKTLTKRKVIGQAPRGTFANLFLILLVMSSTIGCERDEGAMISEWRASTWRSEVRFLSAEALRRVEAPIAALFQGAQDDAITQTLSEAGLTLRPLRHGEILLKEKKDSLGGLGFFLLRAEQSLPLLIQAPHSFHDLRTGEIAIKLFREGRAQALALNTAQRQFIDLAKEEETLFFTFMRSFLTVAKGGVVLQLHGFARGKRNTRQGRDAQIIVSSGETTPPLRLRRFAADLKKHFGDGVMLYPDEVTELGGTQNSYAKALRSDEDVLFIHLELSRKIRERIYSTPSDRTKLLRSISEVIE